MSVIRNNLLLTDDGYNISRSVRLRKSATAYFNRTFSTPTNNKIWTWSGWVKRGQLGVAQAIIGTTDNNTASANFGVIRFNASDYLEYFEYATGYTLQISSNGVYRDPSAWYHIVIAIDTTQATAANRTKFYVNGTAVSMSLTTSPSQNYNTYINSAVATYQGAYNNSGTGIQTPFDAYLTEVNFIDGQTLTPSSFGETDSITGVWKPKKYTGTYGTNGFYLNFSDNSSNTATTIGKDYSGNGNNWTPNNISVTSGATYDSMLDVPTMWADGGNGRGNYCTLNPLAVTSVAATFAEGNLKVTTGAAGGNGYGTMAIPASGKWYWEVTFSSGSDAMIGLSAYLSTQTYAWQNGNSVFYYYDGQKYIDGAGSSYGATYTTGDVIGVAVNADTGTVTFYKNNTSQGSITHTVTDLLPCIADGSASLTATCAANFGQRPFTYTPPTGFKALNTQNLPDATIKKGNAYFDATTYTGNGSALTVTNSGGMQPDLLWAKQRSSTAWHYLQDAVRGVNKALFSNATDAEYSIPSTTTTLNSNGFSFNGAESGLNANAATYVAWQWKESASAGFDIVTYTGNSTNRTIAHSLGVAPQMIIVKNRSAVYDWPVYHSVNGATKYMYLNTTSVASVASSLWNDTAPTSSVFSVGTSGAVNNSSQNYVAYLFAEVAGYSKFGSYTGNGSTDGPFVYTGFRPRFVMVKRTDSTGDWQILDSSRSSYNAVDARLWADLSNAEVSNTGGNTDFTSNGFKLRNTNGDDNVNGGTFIYAAFAENPFKNSLAR
jgi:hypothetical protein